MTIKLSERKVPSIEDITPTDSESVSQYLYDHPGFFEQYPELLNNLRLPHPERGSAISLVERQVHNLRSNSKELNQQLQELLEIARENDRLADRLHRLTLTLLECKTIDEILSAIKIGMVEDFGIEQVVIKFDSSNSANKKYERSELIDANENKSGKYLDAKTLVDKIFSKDSDIEPVCFNDVDRGYFFELFNMQSSAISSSVVIPLGGQPATGLLALGSTNAKRFRPGMSIVFLKRLTDLINTVLNACNK